MPQPNDRNRNQGGQGGQGGRQNRDDMQRTPGTDQGGGRGGVQSPQRDGGQGQRMNRPDSDDSGRSDDQE